MLIGYKEYAEIVKEHRARNQLMDKIKVQRVGDHDLPIPTRATDGAAAHDLCIAIPSFYFQTNTQALIPTGFAWEIPKGFVGLVTIRSGAGKLGMRLTNGVGVIDSDYRGEVLLSLVNCSPCTKFMARGDRIAQMVIVPIHTGEVVEVDELSETDRGDGGFGSTGV